MATAVWTVPARLTSAIATLLSKQIDQDEDLYDQHQALIEQLTGDNGSENSSAEVEVNLGTGENIFNILCGLCLELDTENAAHEDKLASLERESFMLQKKVAVLQSQLQRRGADYQGPDGRHRISSPVHYATEEQISPAGKAKTVLSATPVLPYGEPSPSRPDGTTHSSQSFPQMNAHDTSSQQSRISSPSPREATPPNLSSSSQTLRSDPISSPQAGNVLTPESNLARASHRSPERLPSPEQSPSNATKRRRSPSTTSSHSVSSTISRRARSSSCISDSEMSISAVAAALDPEPVEVVVQVPIRIPRDPGAFHDVLGSIKVFVVRGKAITTVVGVDDLGAEFCREVPKPSGLKQVEIIKLEGIQALRTLNRQGDDLGQDPGHPVLFLVGEDMVIHALQLPSTGDLLTADVPLAAVVRHTLAPAIVTRRLSRAQPPTPRRHKDYDRGRALSHLKSSTLPARSAPETQRPPRSRDGEGTSAGNWERILYLPPRPDGTAGKHAVWVRKDSLDTPSTDQRDHPLSVAPPPVPSSGGRLHPPSGVIPRTTGPGPRDGFTALGPHWNFHSKLRNRDNYYGPGQYGVNPPRSIGITAAAQSPQPPSRPLLERVSSVPKDPEGPNNNQPPPSLASRMSPVRPMRNIHVSHGLLKRSPLNFATGRLRGEASGPPKLTGSNQVPVANLGSRIMSVSADARGGYPGAGGVSG
ncbi:hypothetical protein FS837_002019 [Tulasnella sp. UAMH 9824]|nr:hypothetical protein FS837_002019 [Tulasnella sp. UAMH 9824]